MSQEHDKSRPETDISDGIHPEAAPFEPSYQPETLPKISVPDLAEDAQGLSAEALAQVPTLTEEAPSEKPEVTQVHDLHEQEDIQTEPISPELVEAPIQDEPAQADTWGEVLHARMGKLTDDIQTLNVRLDRLEERNKAKV